MLFFPKNAGVSKIEGVLVLKGTFSETTYVCVLSTEFQASNIILTSFRWGSNFAPPPRLHFEKNS